MIVSCQSDALSFVTALTSQSDVLGFVARRSSKVSPGASLVNAHLEPHISSKHQVYERSKTAFHS